ncbi:MAG: hypothetical protein E6J02_02665 [Chloroflexi bacterium]|nr:MAG: hypothetical protein E6J02_02665 [Chloroflexota bacterium]
MLTQRTIREVEAGFASAVVTAMGEEGDLVAIRLARGCRCFAAWSGEEVLAYGWLSSGPEWIGELGREIRPAAGEAYLWNCLTLDPHRRQGRFREIVLAIASSARKEGITRLWIGTIGDLGVRTLPEIGFTPVLCFAVQNLPWIRYLRVWPAEEADARLVEAARSALRADGRPLLGGSVLGRHGRRRH